MIPRYPDQQSFVSALLNVSTVRSSDLPYRFAGGKEGRCNNKENNVQAHRLSNVVFAEA